jgi:hypothetical protein
MILALQIGSGILQVFLTYLFVLRLRKHTRKASGREGLYEEFAAVFMFKLLRVNC